MLLEGDGVCALKTKDFFVIYQEVIRCIVWLEIYFGMYLVHNMIRDCYAMYLKTISISITRE